MITQEAIRDLLRHGMSGESQEGSVISMLMLLGLEAPLTRVLEEELYPRLGDLLVRSIPQVERKYHDNTR